MTLFGGEFEAEVGRLVGQAEAPWVAAGSTKVTPGTLDPVRRLLFSPRWLAGHIAVAACFVGFLALGWWQWKRAHAADGGGQNLGYALQWPLFAAFALFGWWRVLKLELAKTAPPRTAQPNTALAKIGPQKTAPPASRPDAPEPVRRGPAVPRYVPPPVEDASDDELAEYNRRLSALHEQDQLQMRSDR